MPIITVRHLTRYRYRKPVAFGEHRMMLRPQEAADQRLVDYDLYIAPQPVTQRTVQDAHGNAVTLATFARKAKVFEVEARFTIDHRPLSLADRRGGLMPGPITPVPFAYDEEEEAADLALLTQGTDSLAVSAFARRFTASSGPTPLLHALAEMTGAIRADFTYQSRLVGGAQSAEQTLFLRSGACRDFAVLMMDSARSLGLAARYVSGYVVSSAKADGSPRLGGGHTHAWVQVYLPPLGWIDFDPTNGIVGAQGLIRAMVVRTPRQANVLSGDFDGDAGDYLGMDVEVDVADAPAGSSMEPSVRVAA